MMVVSLVRLIEQLTIRRSNNGFSILQSELESEQKKHNDKCIFHQSKSHPTAACENILSDKIDSNSPTLLTSTSGQLQNVKEKVLEDAVSEDTISKDVPDAMLDLSTNDTNED
jgi:hypothetical protein